MALPKYRPRSGKPSDILDLKPYRPGRYRQRVIPTLDISSWSLPSIERDDPSSLGSLDGLPLEILQECLDHLDIVSLIQLSRVSLCGMAVVKSLPALRTLIYKGGKLLTILAQAQILGLHSLASLSAALHSERCTSCGDYGAFLHILSAERCCFNCLGINQSLWMMPVSEVQGCFSLTIQQVESLPVMSSIPGKYTYYEATRPSIKLTSVGAAKTLALKVHKSLKGLRTRNMPLDPESNTEYEVDIWTWYRQAPMQPYSRNPLAELDKSVPILADPYGGMGVFQFPSISNAQMEYGQWCQACEGAHHDHMFLRMAPSAVERMVPQKWDPDAWFWRMHYRAWSRAGFLRHMEQYHDTPVRLLDDDVEERWEEFLRPGMNLFDSVGL